jgi:5-methylcytosine-specific restriction endonuclease McrA
MILVNRGEPPKDFEKRAKALRKKFKAARAKDPDISASKFWQSVRPDLTNDATELARRHLFKCAYCESLMNHVSYPHVEHYKPKGQKQYEKLMFVWTNWLSSCGVCNDTKWTQFPIHNGKPLLLNPTVDDPSIHIGFRRNSIFSLSDEGDETIRLVGLWRYDLEKERGSWLLNIDILLLLITNSQDAEVRSASRECLIWAMQDNAPYAAMTRQYLKNLCPNFANPKQPHPLIGGENIRQKIALLVAQNRKTVCQLI